MNFLGFCCIVFLLQQADLLQACSKFNSRARNGAVNGNEATAPTGRDSPWAVGFSNDANG
jgi:hypothetical protein